MLGKTRWAIAEGYIPEAGPYADTPALRSHETACILDPGLKAAELKITFILPTANP